MARLAGVDLPRNKRVEIGLTYLFGIGRATANRILASTGIDVNIRIKDLTPDDVNKIRQFINDHLKVEGELRGEIGMHIKRLMDINTYRGTRHRKKLPARGQRTRTNSRTRRGTKRVAIAKKKVEGKG